MFHRFQLCPSAARRRATPGGAQTPRSDDTLTFIDFVLGSVWAACGQLGVNILQRLDVRKPDGMDAFHKLRRAFLAQPFSLLIVGSEQMVGVSALCPAFSWALTLRWATEERPSPAAAPTVKRSVSSSVWTAAGPVGSHRFPTRTPALLFSFPRSHLMYLGHKSSRYWIIAVLH